MLCDASLKAYGPVIYITCGEKSARAIARTRVAPLKQLTLPRLEFMVAVIGSRLLHHVLQTIPATAVYLWSDSQIVLHWLSSNRKLKTFEQNRVSEIHRLTENRKWMYCPTDHNPADLLTRGIKAEEFTKSRLWDKEPDWLTNKNNNPIQLLATSTMLLTDVEEKDVSTSETLVTKTDGIHNLIDINRFSRYRKLLRVTAYVLRFIQNCRPSTTSDRMVTLSVKELKDAESVWLRSCQATTYGAESTCLKDGKINLPLVRQVQLFHGDDGYIRCGSRIHNAPLLEQTRFPPLFFDETYYYGCT